MSTRMDPQLFEQIRAEITPRFENLDMTRADRKPVAFVREASAKAIAEQDWAQVLRLADSYCTAWATSAIYHHLIYQARVRPAGDRLREDVLERLAAGGACGNSFIASSACVLVDDMEDIQPFETTLFFQIGHPRTDPTASVWRAMIARGIFPRAAEVRSAEAAFLIDESVTEAAGAAFSQFQARALEEELAASRNTAPHEAATVTGGL